MRVTHTYSILEVAPDAYDEIRGKLAEAGWDDSIFDDDEGELISLQGLALRASSETTPLVRPLDEWTEDHGFVVWWRMPVDEPPWVGTPLCSDWKDGYFTHWTVLVEPTDSTTPAEP